MDNINSPPNLIINNETEILILGTRPGEKSLEKGNYYAKKGNRFWKIMEDIYPELESKEYDEKINFLRANKIGLWDVLRYHEGRGSLDKNIKNEQPNDFKNLFNHHKNIKKVLFNGLKDPKKFFNKHKCYCPNNIKPKPLPSTSGMNTKYSIQDLIKDWKEAIRE